MLFAQTSKQVASPAPAIFTGIANARKAKSRPIDSQLNVNPVIRWAFYLFALSIGLEYPALGIPMETATFIGGIFLLATLIQPHVCYKQMPKAIRYYAAMVGVFILLSPMAWGKYPYEVFRLLALLIQMILLIWVGYNLFQNERIRKGFLVAIALSGVTLQILQLSGLASSYYDPRNKVTRLSVLGQDPNALASFLAIAIVTIIGLGYCLKTKENKIPRIMVHLLVWPIVAALVMMISNTGSRGGLLSLMVGMVALMPGGKTIFIKVRNFLVVGLAIGLFFYLANQSETASSRYKDYQSTGSTSGRERIHNKCKDMIKERPLHGWGPVSSIYELGNRTVERGRHHRYRHPHHLFYEVATSTGLLGAIPLLITLGLCMHRAWKARIGSHGALPLALAVTALMLSQTVNGLITKSFWLVWIYALVCGEQIIREKKRRIAFIPRSKPGIQSDILRPWNINRGVGFTGPGNTLRPAREPE